TRVSYAFSVLASIILGLAASVGYAQSTIQIPQAPAMSATALAEVLDKGQTFEAERRWGEAYALYEEATRKNPGQPDLERRLDLAKMHFDIGRRYADSAFRRSVGQMSDADALAMYSDASAKLQSHYVQAPQWARLVGRGNMNLE